jgi:putative membrane protein
VVIRPSIRIVKAFYYFAFILVAVYFFLVNNNPESSEGVHFLLIIPLALLVWTIVKHISLRFVSLTISGNKVRYQKGILSKYTRTLELSKVQDVGVTQSMTQRLLGVGDISVETAGDSAPLWIRNVDRPQAVADYILESVRG